MELLQLPPEILTAILEALLYEPDIGIRGVLRFRTVCRTFGDFIPDLIYALPIFDSYENKTSLHLSWHARMPPKFLAALITSKLQNKPSSRYLISEIQQTVNYIKSNLSLQDTSDYATALVLLASENIPVQSLVRRISLDSADRSCADGLLNNALAAAIYLDRAQDISILLSRGAQAHSRTRSFGAPLAVAASHASISIFHSIFSVGLAERDHHQKHLIESRMLAALEHAAYFGHARVFCEATWNLLYKHFPDSQRVFLAITLKSALSAGQDDVVNALMELIEQYGISKIHREELHVWIEIIRLALRRNHRQTFVNVQRFTSVLDFAWNVDSLVAEAIRFGHLDMIPGMLEHPKFRKPQSYTSSIYWAARNGYWHVIPTLPIDTEGFDEHSIVTALCGASAHWQTKFAKFVDKPSFWNDITRAIMGAGGDVWRGLQYISSHIDQICPPSTPCLVNNSNVEKVKRDVENMQGKIFERSEWGSSQYDSMDNLLHTPNVSPSEKDDEPRKLVEEIAQRDPEATEWYMCRDQYPDEHRWKRLTRLLNAFDGGQIDDRRHPAPDGVGNVKCINLARAMISGRISMSGAENYLQDARKLGSPAIICYVLGKLQEWAEPFPEMGGHLYEGFVPQYSVLQVYFDAKWNPNIPAEIGSPQLAPWLESESRVLDLLDHGADPNVLNRSGDTLLSCAVWECSFNTVMLLLRNGGDVQKGELLENAIMRTEPQDQCVQIAMVDLLIAYGAPLNARKFESNPELWERWQDTGLGTALHIAVARKNEDIVRLLLRHGADVHVKDSIGRTPYDLAVLSGFDHLALILKDHDRV